MSERKKNYKPRPSGPKKYFPKKKAAPSVDKTDDGIRLNKFLSNAGVCSRREADTLIEAGIVTINGKVVTQLGTKVYPTDIVKYDGQTLKSEKTVYVLLNKPKGFLTTVKDPYNRKTVMDLVAKACKERIYPVGRLDKDTTGVLLLTNDGATAKKLTHPKHGVKKIYHVYLDKGVSKSDLERLLKGVRLSDGPVKADEATYVGNGEDKKQVGVVLHSGKNRVVRRMFEKVGYTVVKLDRVAFGPLTKKGIPRGKFRILDEKEIGFLKQVK